MNNKDKIAIFGSGMLGSAIYRNLEARGHSNVQMLSLKNGFDLLQEDRVNGYMNTQKPAYLFMVAGLVGGINANNTRQADFLYENAKMILHVLEAVKGYSAKTKILYTGSTCIYPKVNPQPIKEERFMTGPLEETNKGYAVAKGLGIVACEMYNMQYGINAISAMPSNLYGPNDNYDLNNSHFIPALIKRLINAKETSEPPVFWGTGKPRREAVYVDDCAEVLVYLMENYNSTKIVNVGTGYDYSIKEFVDIAKKILKYKGEIKWDATKPDGILEKRVDISYLKSLMPGYNPRSFEQGLRDVLKIDFGIEV